MLLKVKWVSLPFYNILSRFFFFIFAKNKNFKLVDKLIKKLAGQTIIYGLSSIIGRFLNYLLVPLYTYTFATEQYGIVSEFYAYMPLLLILLTYGTETGFFRFARDKNQDFNKVYSTILTSLFVSTLVFSGLMLLFITPVSTLVLYPNNPEYIVWTIFIVATDALISIPFARLRIEGKAFRFAIIKLANILITIGLNLFFIVILPKLSISNPNSILLIFYCKEIGIGYIFIANLVANILTLVFLLPQITNIKYQFDKIILKKVLNYSAPLLIAGFAGMINETLDRILIKYILTSQADEVFAQSQLGIYSANYKLAILMTLFIQMFRYAAEPFFFENKNENNARELYAKTTKYFIICGLTIFLMVVLYIDAFKLFIGPSYREGITIVPILLLANLFLGVFYNFSIWYKLNDMTRYGAYLAVFGAVITILLNILLIPQWGYIGSAWATFVCYLSMMILSCYWGQKYYKIPYQFKNAVFYLFVALGLYVLNLFIDFDNQVLKYTVKSILLIFFIMIGLRHK